MKRRVASMLGVAAFASACGLSALATSGADAGADLDAAAVRPGDPDARGGIVGPGDAPGGDAPVPDVGAPDTSMPPLTAACSPGQVLCGATCLNAASCAGCAAAKFHCKGTRTCVTGCSTCRDVANMPAPVECVICDTSQNGPIASCEPDAPSNPCLSGDLGAAYNGGAGQRCNCNNAQVASCTSGTHVCLSAGGEDYCTTCGHAGTAGKPCKNGGTCNASLSPPRCE